MRSPSKFGGLERLTEQSVDTPCVDEDAWGLRTGGDLGVTFSDVYALDPEIHGKFRPFLPSLWY